METGQIDMLDYILFTEIQVKVCVVGESRATVRV